MRCLDEKTGSDFPLHEHVQVVAEVTTVLPLTMATYKMRVWSLVPIKLSTNRAARKSTPQ